MTDRRLQLRRDADCLYDLTAHRAIGLDELAEHVRVGGTFRAVAHDTGVDCTRSVLAEMLRKEAGRQVTGGLSGGIALLQEAGRAILGGLVGGAPPRSVPCSDREPDGRGTSGRRPGGDARRH